MMLRDLPLFASDEQIGEALLGKKRAREFAAMAPLLEAKGLPAVDTMMGGRFVPAIVEFFYQQYSLATTQKSHVAALGGTENLNAWHSRSKRRG